MARLVGFFLAAFGPGPGVCLLCLPGASASLSFFPRGGILFSLLLVVCGFLRSYCGEKALAGVCRLVQVRSAACFLSLSIRCFCVLRFLGLPQTSIILFPSRVDLCTMLVRNTQLARIPFTSHTPTARFTSFYRA